MSRTLRRAAAVGVFFFVALQGAADEPGAGVLAFHREDGSLTVLLGLDERRDGGHTWSDFVGKIEDRDDGTVSTASREFTEETRGAYSAIGTSKELSKLVPHRVGDSWIFLYEVDYVAAATLGNLPKISGYENIRYCWVELRALLSSIDDDESDSESALVPQHCDPSSCSREREDDSDSDDEVPCRRPLYNRFYRNLAIGGVLREPLLGLDDSPLRQE